MKKLIVSFLLGGVLGGLAGFAIGIFVYPYIFLADIVADEKIVDVENKQVVASGEFIHANPADPVHYGNGKTSVYKDIVHLEQDFEVGPGPAYHVYLVPEDGDVTPDTDVAATMFIDLGRLRAFKGSQIYPIPEGVDVKKYGNVVIWCEHFGVLISPAKLVYR